MNCELFSIRGDNEEISRLNENLKNIVRILAKLDIHVIYKTEVDRNTSKIEEAILYSVNDSNSPELIIIANALDTTCGADFSAVFSKILLDCENRYKNSLPAEDRQQKFNVKVFPIDNLGCGHSGFCFTIYNTKIVVLPRETLVHKDITSLIYEAVTCALVKFRGSNFLFPNGFVFETTQNAQNNIDFIEETEIVENPDEENESSEVTEKKKKKKGFLRRNIPWKGDRPVEIVRKSVILVALITIVVCVSMILNELVIMPAQNAKRQSIIQDIFYSRPTSDTSLDSTEEESTEPYYNWEALKEVNDEIIGWISIDNTVIDYPVLCHPDDPAGTTNPYYLNHNYEDQWDSYGSIFTDPTSYAGLNTKNIVLHGHHMNDGSMFGNLANYGTGFADGSGTPYVNFDFYKSAPIIHFNTPQWNADWKIIAVIHTNALESHGEFFNYLIGSFNTDEEFLDFVYDLRERSIIDTPVTVNEDDQLITLSTCTYEFENFRTAVIARKVRPGEDSSVDVDSASLNSDMLWPDIYYRTYGGTKPEDKSFSQAYEDGDISWYDGDLFSNET